MNPRADPGPAPAPAARKPRLSILIATVFGLGYLPIAPGTWGSLAGVVFATSFYWFGFRHLVSLEMERNLYFWTTGFLPSYLDYAVAFLVGALGVFAAARVASYFGQEDPQFIVVDEFSGQLLTYFFPMTLWNWKTLLLGFILFRVFDIWKPFPARQAERLPGGWGIMADDWVAAIYAALGLWLARALGL